MVVSFLRGFLDCYLLGFWRSSSSSFQFFLWPRDSGFFLMLDGDGLGIRNDCHSIGPPFWSWSGKPRWVAIFAFAPISAVYYPVETLPAWLQIIAWCTPSAYVFEGMRSVLIDNNFRYDLLLGAILVNIIYLFAGIFVFSFSFLGARKQGNCFKQASSYQLLF